MNKFHKGFVLSNSTLVIGAIILVLCAYYFYVTYVRQSPDHISVTGNVVYVSPANYNFFILSSSTTAVHGSLPSMNGFPSVGDPNYHYIGDAGYTGTLPHVGDKVMVGIDINTSVETNPPNTFSDSATTIDVLVDAQFNAYVKSLIQTIQ